MTNISIAEYIWIDGDQPTQQLRSKARVVQLRDNPVPEDFPLWSFDGSSTQQASGEDSDCILVPVRVARDPGGSHRDYLVLCEVMQPSGHPHVSNQRARLQQALAQAGADAEPWIGFEQEYTLYREGRPLGFPEGGYPSPQGPYYCGVGADRVFGRELADAHASLCLYAGLMLYGINAEVMPGQWEFQIGHRGVDGETAEPLVVCDHLWLARFLLHREGERLGYRVSLDNKPVAGDWNGAGMHTNFSTADTRNPTRGRRAIDAAIEALSKRHDLHIAHYGAGLSDRLTGHHETCSIGTFQAGVAHRGASIRIPQPVAQIGHGYFEDRRPGANADPYQVAACLVTTVCAGSTWADRLGDEEAAA